MSRGRIVTTRRVVLGAGLLALAGMGCNPSWLYFLQRDDKQEPAYPLPPKDGRKEVTVVVLTAAAPTLGIDFAGAERELAGLVGKRLADETREDKRPIQVIDPAKVERFKTAPGHDWRTMNPATIGQQLGADYVLDVTLNSMSTAPSEYAGEYFKGEATYSVVVYDAAKPDAVLQQYGHQTTLPLQGALPGGAGMYRRRLIERVAAEIAWQHVPHAASDMEVAPIR